VPLVGQTVSHHDHQSHVRRSAGIDKRPGRGPHPQDDAHWCATSRTAGRERLQGLALCRRVIAGMSLHNQQAESREWDGTAGMEQAEMADVHKALGQDVLEASAEKRHDGEVGSAWAGAAHCPIGEGDGAVFEAHETAVGESDPEDIRGQGGAGGVSIMIGLTVDVPGDGPDLGGDGLQPSGVAHGVCAARAVEGGEGCDRDKAVGAGGPPGRAVL
jgi:hypothetical protein